MKKLAILLTVSTLALGGCSWSWPWNWGSSSSAGGAATKESVTAAIADAEAAQKKVGTNAEWRDVGLMIKNAKAALEKGELDNAMKQVKEAKAHIDLGAAQMANQKGVKPWLF